MPEPKMEVWRAISGRYHLRASCSGGPGLAGAKGGRLNKVKVTEEQFREAHENFQLCRCLVWRGVPMWRPEQKVRQL